MTQSLALTGERAKESDVRVIQLDGAQTLADGVVADDRFAFGAAPWLRAWEQAFLPGQGWRGPMKLHAACCADECYGFVALANQAIKGVTVKSLAGYYWPFRTVCASADARKREWFAGTIATHFSRHPPSTVLRFGPIAEDDQSMRALLDALREQGWRRMQKPAGVTIELTLPGDPGALRSQISPSLLKNIDYRRRKIVRDAGEITFERNVLRGDCEKLTRDLQKVERASWQGMQGGNAKLVGQAEELFWRNVAALPQGGVEPVAWVLRCAGQAIAFQIHLETRDTIYKVGSCYDQAWKSYGPGSLLTYEIFSDVCRRGARRIDWGRGDSGYKSTWGAVDAGKLYEVLMFSPGLPGRAALALARRALAGWTVADDF